MTSSLSLYPADIEIYRVPWTLHIRTISDSLPLWPPVAHRYENLGRPQSHLKHQPGAQRLAPEKQLALEVSE